MIISVHQPQYLPWLGYFHKIDKSDCFVFLDTVQYKKREFQNRNKIKTKNDWIWLTVPVKTKGSAAQPIFDVLVDNQTNWQAEHKKSLQVWYAKAPFFDKYFPFFENVYEKQWCTLIDLNITIIKYILEVLEINTSIKLESDLGTTQKSTARIIEICQKLKAQEYLSGTGGREYLDETLFGQNNISLKYQKFTHPVYQQQVVDKNSQFQPYMSIVDLLFNEGPRSIEIIRQQDASSK
ncbi:MAG: WbqC family protein [Candidatus Omnitrophota bacterium]